MPYSSCTYSGYQYYQTFKAVAAQVRIAFPTAIIHVDSGSGQESPGGKLIRQDSAAEKLVDAWTWHRVGDDSNDQIVAQSCLLGDGRTDATAGTNRRNAPRTSSKLGRRVLDRAVALCGKLVALRHSDEQIACCDHNKDGVANPD
jgi:hypothetical protein